MPECALGSWTPFPFVIDAFLVRAAHDAVSHDDRKGALDLDELKYLAGDGHVRAHVAGFYLPVPHLARLGVLGTDDAHGNFGGAA